MSILTFKQFDSAARRRVAEKYDVTLAEIGRLYAPSHFATDWSEYAVKAYDSGAAFTACQWKKLPPFLQRRVLRTPRALRMPGNQTDPWKKEA